MLRENRIRFGERITSHPSQKREGWGTRAARGWRRRTDSSNRKGISFQWFGFSVIGKKQLQRQRRHAEILPRSTRLRVEDGVLGDVPLRDLEFLRGGGGFVGDFVLS
jgi:hypothetical protein